MRQPRSRIGAELVPLVLILACLAGSLAMIVTVHRRAITRRPEQPTVAVALAPEPGPPQPSPIPTPVVVVAPEVEEREPAPAPTPIDPTPGAIARLTSAEAEQLLEASRADRKTAAIEAARKAAQLASEKWRRRESLIRLQLDSLDSKARKIETEVDELALERDALEKERDARKAMAAQARSRPGQAILPHRGQNGTWRRPIVIECSNGMAILRPQGIGFGLLELASGFGPGSNAFVATVAREAVRIQGNSSPDGQQVIPYIFFLVRPDGIRSYYEARGRLEPLGITFGYELADQDWEIEFPDLDDIKTWDGSAPTQPDTPDPLAQSRPRAPGASPAEDEDFPTLGPAGRLGSSARRAEGPGGEFTWPPRSRSLDAPGGGGAGGLTGLNGPSGPSRSRTGLRYSNSSVNRQSGPSDLADGRPSGAMNGPEGPSIGNGASSGVGSGSGTGPGRGAGPGDPVALDAPRELALGGGPIPRLNPVGDAPPAGSSGIRNDIPAAPADAPSAEGDSATAAKSQAKDDPANTFVWPAKPSSGGRAKSGDRSSPTTGDGGDPADSTPPVRHPGPFSRPLARGLDSIASSNPSGPTTDPAVDDPTRPDGNAGSPSDPAQNPTRGGGSATASNPKGQAGSPPTTRGIGQGGTPNSQPPPGSIGVGMPGMPEMPQDGTPPPMNPPPISPRGRSSRAPALPEPSPTSIVDRRFEVVVVCGPRGVIVQPGGYRVTADALKDRDGLMKKQIVALVKARRTADPKTTIEPRVRFLVQAGGDKTYWTARSQFLLSGLDWPISTQVADPDHLTILPSESW